MLPSTLSLVLCSSARKYAFLILFCRPGSARTRLSALMSWFERPKSVTGSVHINAIVNGRHAHGHEACVAERELAGVTVDQIEADGEDDIDARDHQHIRVVEIDPVVQIRSCDAEHERHEKPEPGTS